MKIYNILFMLLLISITVSCEDSVQTKSLNNDGIFELTNINAGASTSRLDILYNNGFAGQIKYIVSTVNLNITNENEFNASGAVKTTATITSDGLSYNNYIKLNSLSGTTYYVYILNIQTGDVSALVENTGENTTPGRTAITGTITGSSSSYTYTISFPANYNASSSVKWPFLIELKTSAFDDINSPFVVFQVDVYSGSSTDYDAINNIRSTINAFIENPANNIDKNRIYTFGFSAGGNASIILANNDGSSQYNFKAVIVTGVSSWLSGSNCNNLASTNVWMFYGSADTTVGNGTPTAFAAIPSGSGEHILTCMPGVTHTASPVYDSPIVMKWLLSK